MKSRTNKEIIAGAFFVVSIFFIIIVIFSLGAKVGIGESKFYQYVLFNDIGGLKIGAPVRISGVTVGSVVDIEFIRPVQSGQRVRVTLSVLSKYKKELDEHSLYTVKTEGLLGDKLIDIQKNPTAMPVQLSKKGYVIGQDAIDLYNLADDFSETTEYFNYLSTKMAGLVDDLQIFTRLSARTVERVEDKVIEGGLFSLFTKSGEK
ncbi:MAG: MCE family protein [Candidatus Omnitrophica bacterium]|nr:MCE family protein [Candidatus Omnitrophota bacterium]